MGWGGHAGRVRLQHNKYKQKKLEPLMLAM